MKNKIWKKKNKIRNKIGRSGDIEPRLIFQFAPKPRHLFILIGIWIFSDAIKIVHDEGRTIITIMIPHNYPPISPNARI